MSGGDGFKVTDNRQQNGNSVSHDHPIKVSVNEFIFLFKKYYYSLLCVCDRL